MDKMVSIGIENFEEMIRDDEYYVDKTELLYELAAKTRNKVTLFTRPRRFGKTLTISMMESFFDITRDSRDVFEHLNIWKHSEFCDAYRNQYPVLSLSFKDVDGLTFEDAFAMLKNTLSRKCTQFERLAEDDRVTQRDRNAFSRLLNETGTISDLKSSLDTLMRMMHSVYGKPVILFIDEYDVPLAKAEIRKDEEFYQQMLDVIRGMMSVSLKTNEHLKFAVITGCLRIAKESIFTGVNNFKCYSVLDKKFSQYFGFTKEEVEDMLAAVKLSEKMPVIQEWYDGYIFGNNELFCPWDVSCYVSDALEGGGETPRNYWANTSGNTILDDFINHPQIDVSDKFETLLNGGSITEEVSMELTYDQLAKSEKNLWSVLLMTGYVSKTDKSDMKGKARLRIPNTEISEIFRDTVVNRFQRTLDASLVDQFISAMWNQDEKTASTSLTEILWNSISYFDYSESYYHGMLNGIFTSRGYQPESNEEAGLGRLDLRVKDKANKRLLLFEFKRSEMEADLDKDCDTAIAQIIKNGYAKTLPEGYRQQIVYGIAFFGKKAEVKRLR